MTAQQKKETAKKMAELADALGAVAEMSLIFNRACKAAGASKAETADLTRAYIEAIYGHSKRKTDGDNHGD